MLVHNSFTSKICSIQKAGASSVCQVEELKIY
uniref:Uncharacterized protein n=1 Tax=Arundo donax TaxID=35708 RepID=A0A0A9AYU9_ARUDO